MLLANFAKLKNIALSIAVLIVSWSGYAKNLYQFQQKKYTKKDLSPAVLQQLYEAELDYYKQVSRIISEDIFEKQIEKDAKKTNKDLNKFKEETFSAGTVTEKEIKEFYQQNKDRIPYDYERAKPQLTKYLQTKKRVEKKESYLKKIKKEGKFLMLIPEPDAPVFTIDITGLPAKGNKEAKVTVIEFFDYQCPHCKEVGKYVKEVLAKFKNSVKLVHIDFPVNRSGISELVARGAFCANKQNKYWQYHDLAFSKQKGLNSKSPIELAKELKLNIKEFESCFASDSSQKFVNRGKGEARRLGIHGTPSFIVNGKKLIFNNLKTDLEGAISKALAVK